MTVTAVKSLFSPRVVCHQKKNLTISNFWSLSKILCFTKVVVYEEQMCSVFLWHAVINGINSKLLYSTGQESLERRDDAWMTKCFEKHTGFVFFFTNSLNYELQASELALAISFCFFCWASLKRVWKIYKHWTTCPGCLRLSAPVTGSQCHALVFAFTFIAFFIVLYPSSSCIFTV